MAIRLTLQPVRRLLNCAVSRTINQSACVCSARCTVYSNISALNSNSRTCAVTLWSSFHSSAVSFNEHVFNVQDEADFTKRVTKSSVPVVVDFHATWCGPCKLLGPRLETLVSGQNGKVVLAKIDIDEMTELAVSHGVEAVPTVIAMKDGKVVDKFVGLKDDADLESFVQKLLH